VQGLLYYAGVDHFLSQFDAAGDPPLVEVLLHQADLCDYSAMQVCGHRYFDCFMNTSSKCTRTRFGNTFSLREALHK
jgi:hypothetical protein